MGSRRCSMSAGGTGAPRGGEKATMVRTEAPAMRRKPPGTATPRICSRPQRLGARVPPESKKAASVQRSPRNARGPIVSGDVARRAPVLPRLGTTEAKREGRWGVGVTHSTQERWDSCPSDPAEGRGDRVTEPSGGKVLEHRVHGTPSPQSISTKLGRIASGIANP